MAHQNRYVSQHCRSMHSIHRCLILSWCCALIRLLTLRWLGLCSDIWLGPTLSSVRSLLLALWPCLLWLPIVDMLLTPWPCLLWLPSVDKTVQGGLIGCKHCSILRLGVLCLSWMSWVSWGSLLGLKESRQAKQNVKRRAPYKTECYKPLWL